MGLIKDGAEDIQQTSWGIWGQVSAGGGATHHEYYGGIYHVECRNEPD